MTGLSKSKVHSEFATTSSYVVRFSTDIFFFSFYNFLSSCFFVFFLIKNLTIRAGE